MKPMLKVPLKMKKVGRVKEMKDPKDIITTIGENSPRGEISNKEPSHREDREETRMKRTRRMHRNQLTKSTCKATGDIERRFMLLLRLRSHQCLRRF